MIVHECKCTQDKVAEVLATFPEGRRETLIPLLQAIQEAFGYVPEDAVHAIGKHLGISSSKVYGVATFYNQFRLQPVGRHTIKVCRGTACHVRGSKAILDGFADALNIAPGETTPDGQFTLETVACIGACSIAPVVAVGEDFHGAMTNRKVEAVLKQYRDAE